MASPGIPGIAETPRPGCFPGPPGTRHLVPLVTCLRGLSPSLERPWSPSGKLPLHLPPSLPPGLRPLPTTVGRGLDFFHQSPDLLDLRKKRVFRGYFLHLLFQALLEWRWLHPQGKLSIALPGERDRAEGRGLLFLREELRFFLPGLQPSSPWAQEPLHPLLLVLPARVFPTQGRAAGFPTAGKAPASLHDPHLGK